MGSFQAAITGHRAGKEPRELIPFWGSVRDRDWNPGDVGGVTVARLKLSACRVLHYVLWLLRSFFALPQGLQQPLPLMTSTSTSTSELLLSPHSEPSNLHTETRRGPCPSCLYNSPSPLLLTYPLCFPHPPRYLGQSVNNSCTGMSFFVCFCFFN